MAVFNGNGLGRTGGEALAATGTAFVIDAWQRDATEARGKADGGNFADFAASAADHVLFGEAGAADPDAQIPGRLADVAGDGVWCAGTAAITAEGAMSTIEINDGEIAGAGAQNAGRAGTQAVAAAGAGRGERRLIRNPWRT